VVDNVAGTDGRRIILNDEWDTPPLDVLIDDLLDSDRRGGPTPWGWHKWNDLLQCPRKYDLLYNKDRSPMARSNALEFGGLIHECLALYYEETDAFLSESDDARADRLYGAFCEEPRWLGLLNGVLDSGVESYMDVAQDVKRIMDAYLAFYPLRQDAFLQHEVAAVEEFVEVKGTFPFTSRIDLVYRTAGGLWIVDHKSSRAMTQDLASGWAINGQMLGLAYAATRHWPDERIQGLVINILVRTKSPQFKRVTLPLRTDLIDEWIQKMEVWLTKVMPHYEALDWPPNYASCVHRYGRCPFYSYCEAGEDSALLEDPPPPLDIGDIEV
jgi:hypothetical protein